MVFPRVSLLALLLFNSILTELEAVAPFKAVVALFTKDWLASRA